MKKRVGAMFMALALFVTMLSGNAVFAAEIEEETETTFESTYASLPSPEELEALENSGVATPAAYTVLGAGRHYLGTFTFKDTNTGLIRTYNGNRVRICIAWKSADAGGDVDLIVKMHKVATGGYWMTKFSCYEDTDGKDADGYYYLVGDWMDINDYDRDRYIFLDAVTREGYTAPGYLRSANVHIWVDIE